MFRMKLFSELDNVSEVNNLKDFCQEDIHNFFKYRGMDLYDKNFKLSNLDKTVKLSSVKRGSFNKITLNKYIKSGLSIISPINDREYKMSGLVDIANENGKFEEKLDIPVKIHNGYLEFPEFDFYIVLAFTLTKYHTPESTWNYRFVTCGNNYPKPVITVPTKDDDWKEILLAITEYLSNLRLMVGSIYKLYLCPSKEGVPEEKYYSSGVTKKLVSLIPTGLALIYRKFVAPAIEKHQELEWNKTLRVKYSPGLQDKIINYAESNYKDKLIITNIDNHSYFLNVSKNSEMIKTFTNPMILAKYDIDPDRKRTPFDFWALAAREKKDLICYCDTDPLPAVAHEIGHFLQNHEEKLGAIQRANKRGIFSDDFVKLVSFILGASSSIDSVGMAGEITGMLAGMALRTPTLISEFYASYYGIQLIEKVGASEEDIKNAKYSLKLAYSTYLNHTVYNSMVTANGRIAGELIKFGAKNLKR